jgi:hypothetical protein
MAGLGPSKRQAAAAAMQRDRAGVRSASDIRSAEGAAIAVEPADRDSASSAHTVVASTSSATRRLPRTQATVPSSCQLVSPSGGWNPGRPPAPRTCRGRRGRAGADWLATMMPDRRTMACSGDPPARPLTMLTSLSVTLDGPNAARWCQDAPSTQRGSLAGIYEPGQDREP